MKTSESIVNLAAALAEMQSDKKVISKSGNNKFDRYSYAMLEDYIRETKNVLAKHGFFIITSTSEALRLDNRTTKAGGSEHAVQVKLAVRLIHKSGEWIEVECLGEGQDRADKAIYKAITGARKYAIASLLGLATSDDPEADEENTPPPPEPPLTTEQEERVNSFIDLIKAASTINDLQAIFSDAWLFAKDLPCEDVRNIFTEVKNTRKSQLLKGV
jgi:hypothetical protein